MDLNAEMQTRRKTEQTIWAAGFMDGEAYIGITRTRHSETWYYRVHISVGQIARGPLDVLKSLFGGSISSSRDKYGRHWQWRVYSQRAIDCIREIQPYLVVKQAQAALLLEFWSVCEDMPRNGKGQFDHMHSGTKELQSQLHAAMMGLNRRRERLSEKAPEWEFQEDAIVRSVANEKATEGAEMTPRLKAV